MSEGGDAIFTVTLSNPSEVGDVVVNYATSLADGDTAEAGDFTHTASDSTGTSRPPLIFFRNSTTLTREIPVPVIDDNRVEGDETFTMTLSRSFIPLPPGVRLGTRTAQATIAASDDAATVSISGGGDVSEGGNAIFTVTLSKLSGGGDVVVNYATSLAVGDTAAAGDFTETSGTLTFEAGTPTLTREITVPLPNDNRTEGDETFTVTLSAPGDLPAGVILGTPTAQATIAASDAATVSISGGGNVSEGGNAIFTVTLSNPSGVADVVVSYATATGTATTADDFTDTSGTLTFEAGTSILTREITVAVADDELAEGAETFTVSLSAPTGLPAGVSLDATTAQATIAASDAATVSISGGGNVSEGGNAIFTVTLSGSPGADVVVSYATATGTATTADDFIDTSGTLIFEAGTSILTRDITVPVADDEMAEGAETFTVSLSAPTGLPAGVSLDATTAQATIAASDAATVSISGGGNVSEGGNAIFTVTLSGSPGADVVVSYATATGTATTADDFIDTSGTLTFEAGTSILTRDITVPVADDEMAEGAETFTVSLSAPTGLPAGVSLDATTAQATIAASDAATVSISGGGNVSEGGNAIFTVTLSGSPGADVVVSYATATGTATTADDFIDTSGTLTFEAGTSILTRDITVPVADDEMAEGAETFTVSLSAPTGLPAGVSLDATTAQATIAASDAAADAGSDQTVDEGAIVILDGSGGISDPAVGDTLRYLWTQDSGTSVTLSDPTAQRPTFTAPVRQSTDDDMLVFRLTVTDGQGETSSDTVTITVSSEVSVQKTVETINRFLHTRTNLILANQPRLSRRINRLQRGVGSEQMSFATGEISKLKPFEFNLRSLGSGNYKFATSLDQVTRAANHLQVTQGGTGYHERRRFDVWFEGSLHKFNGTADSCGDFAIAYLGADYLVSPDLLLGALVQYDRLSDSSTSENYSIDGTGWMAGPYVTARLQDNLYLDARLAWGKSNNDISPPGATYPAQCQPVLPGRQAGCLQKQSGCHHPEPDDLQRSIAVGAECLDPVHWREWLAL